MGTELLERAIEVQPSAIRVLITGYGDVETLTSAINDGQTYQIINKPVDLRILDMVVRRALEAYDANVRERELFESFVMASVTAIEQRDPSTAGHSYRVAMMTTGLAHVVDAVSEGSFADIKFSRDDVDQIKYASLLHDVGKIGVREAVLVKSHKLPPTRLQLLMYRLEQAARNGHIDATERHRYAQIVELLNNPATSASDHLGELALLDDAPFVESGDMTYLRLERGSLSKEERRQIESHVAGTISFLRQLPWPERLGRVVAIAGSHHERLDGSGYPTGTAIVPIEAQMMAICDVYDALVAADRPYKTAVSHDRAVDMLMDMGKRGGLNQELLDYFLGRRVFRAMKYAPVTI